MTLSPFSHIADGERKNFIYVDAIAQCDRCKQTSSFDATDALLQSPLTCRCGGSLRLFSFRRKELVQ